MTLVDTLGSDLDIEHGTLPDGDTSDLSVTSINFIRGLGELAGDAGDPSEIWILGARDREMLVIAGLLRATKRRFTYMRDGLDGVGPAFSQAYGARLATHPHVRGYNLTTLIECSFVEEDMDQLALETQIEKIDHHTNDVNPFDWREASVAQVQRRLGLPETLTIMAAAQADQHCGLGVRGKTEVPAEAVWWDRVQGIAAEPGMDVEKVLHMTRLFEQVNEDAPDVRIGDVVLADLRPIDFGLRRHIWYTPELLCAQLASSDGERRPAIARHRNPSSGLLVETILGWPDADIIEAAAPGMYARDPNAYINPARGHAIATLSREETAYLDQNWQPKNITSGLFAA
jgi:hypothetical protein